MRGASAIQQVLEQNRGACVRAFVIWEPVLVTDWHRPENYVLARVPDARAVQYWDVHHQVSDLLRRRLAANARDPQPACCRRGELLWDTVVVYPANARWDDSLPAAAYISGPVADVQPELAKTLPRFLATAAPFAH